MLKKADSDLVRRQNRGLVLETLRQHGPLARITLGRQTGPFAGIDHLDQRRSSLTKAWSIPLSKTSEIFAKGQARPPADQAGAQSASRTTCWPSTFRSMASNWSSRTSAAPPVQPVKLRLDTYEIPKEEFGPRVAIEIKA